MNVTESASGGGQRARQHSVRAGWKHLPGTGCGAGPALPRNKAWLARSRHLTPTRVSNSTTPSFRSVTARRAGSLVLQTPPTPAPRHTSIADSMTATPLVYPSLNAPLPPGAPQARRESLPQRQYALRAGVCRSFAGDGRCATVTSYRVVCVVSAHESCHWRITKLQVAPRGEARLCAPDGGPNATPRRMKRRL